MKTWLDWPDPINDDVATGNGLARETGGYGDPIRLIISPGVLGGMFVFCDEVFRL